MTATALVQAINWNRIEDPEDLKAWNAATGHFWLPEKVPLSSDEDSWAKLTQAEQTATLRALVAISAASVPEATVGVISLMPYAVTPHEEATYTHISFQNSVHARAASAAAFTLANPHDIDDAYAWSAENHDVREGVSLLIDWFEKASAKRKAAAVIAETVLPAVGYYAPLTWASTQKVKNTADMIGLIARDKASNAAYIGYKYRRELDALPADERRILEEDAHTLLRAVTGRAERIASGMYAGLGLEEGAVKLIRHSANQALDHLGYERTFSAEETAVDDDILALLNALRDDPVAGGAGAGSGGQAAAAVETDDDDWDF